MRLIVCLTLAAAATSVSAVEVYRSVAPDGTVIYSDRPAGTDSESVSITTARAAVPSAPSPSRSSRQDDDADAPSDAADEPPSAAETAEIRARNCEVARARAQNYNNAHRLYRTLPNGEREYLSDAEIDEARAQAAADVENWCD